MDEDFEIVSTIPTEEFFDCGGEVEEGDGRYYKYEPSIWLCDSCHDIRTRNQ
jgi:hypothetical protein